MRREIDTFITLSLFPCIESAKLTNVTTRLGVHASLHLISDAGIELVFVT
jgi:hypothetical protein